MNWGRIGDRYKSSMIRRGERGECERKILLASFVTVDSVLDVVIAVGSTCGVVRAARREVPMWHSGSSKAMPTGGRPQHI